MLLAGDIGGTTVRLALISPDRGPRNPLSEREYKSADYGGLEPVVAHFLQSAGDRPRSACFSVAGPVIDGRAHLTNLPWRLDEADLARNLGLARVDLLNDLACMAHAAPYLDEGDMVVISAGAPTERGPIALVAPGTGLGEAFVVWDGDRPVACASEGGHADFAPNTPLQADLLAFMRQRHGHVSYERVCSGSALPEVYEFLRLRTPDSESAEFRAKLEAAADRSPIIVKAGLQDIETNPLAAQALSLFVEILAAEASNMALKILATGGVYLAGGMPDRVLPLLRRPAFMSAFMAKGRFSQFLHDVPVKVVTINAALLGASIHGLARAGI